MTIDKCRTCKHAFTTGKDRLYCKKSLADKDDCGEYSVIEQEPEQLRVNRTDELISKRAVNILVDELARAISDERCCMSRGRSTATIMQDILDLPPITQNPETVTEFADRCRECGKMRTDELISKREALASIKALYPNMMPVIDYFGARRKWFEKNKPYFECENAIMSLQPAKQDSSRDIEEIEEVINCDADTETKCKMISNILTAKPHYFKKQEPTGHWIIMGGRYIKCSECGHVTKTESPDIYNFCMVCGTKMSENPTYPESEG